MLRELWRLLTTTPRHRSAQPPEEHLRVAPDLLLVSRQFSGVRHLRHGFFVSRPTPVHAGRRIPLEDSPRQSFDSGHDSRSTQEAVVPIPDMLSMGIPTMVRDFSPRVGIIGCGRFGRAIAGLIVDTKAAKAVVFGVRQPIGTVRLGRSNAQISSMTVARAAEASDILLLAVPSTAYYHLVDQLRDVLAKRPDLILVDVANRERSHTPMAHGSRLSFLKSFEDLSIVNNRSLASQFSRMLHDRAGFKGAVIKAFNTNMAHELEARDVFAGRLVTQVSGDDPRAKRIVADLASSMGFEVHDYGALEVGSKRQEDMVYFFFNGGKTAGAIMVIVWIFWAFYALFSRYLLVSTVWKKEWPLQILESSTGGTAMTCFCLVCLPGTLTTIFQFGRDRKKGPLPFLLEKLLSIRKQLGLLAFWNLASHVAAALLLTNQTNAEQIHQDYRGPLHLTFGIISLALLYVLAKASCHHIASNLSWRELQWIFSYIASLGLFFAVSHAMTLASTQDVAKSLRQNVFPSYYAVVMLPSTVLLSKVMLSCVLFVRMMMAISRQKPRLELC